METINDFVDANQTPSPGQNHGLDERRTILGKCMEVLNDHQARLHHARALLAIKIISRQKADLDQLVDEKLMDMLLEKAGIVSSVENIDLNEHFEAYLEAHRCLNNLSLQSGVARTFLCRQETIASLVSTIIDWKARGSPMKKLIFDIKLLFLITALCQEMRKVVYLDHRGVPRLNSVITSMIHRAKERVVSNGTDDSPSRNYPVLHDNEVDVVCEILKTMFNFTLNVEEESMDEEEEAHMNETCDHLQTLFTIGVVNEEEKSKLHSNCTNIISNIPLKLTTPLLTPLKRDIVPPDVNNIEYDGEFMNSIQAILDLILSRTDRTDTSLKETLTPGLSVLCNLSRYHRKVRKYLRAEILPPLRDVTTRPEIGNKARNKLCQLLTSPIDSVSSIAAEFLFVLCKESVARLVKYTGYGNAAGLLARRGLMLGGKGENAGDYSDEEDSETEEYTEIAHKVNPVVGCVEPDRPSPLDGMTEEQKEYEAMKLVNLIDELHRKGIVKPAVTGEDGKPREVEHVLELQENAIQNRSQQNDRNGEEASD